MFICEECMKSNFENDFFAPIPSYGPCAICKQNKECEDVPHRYLRKKTKLNLLRLMEKGVRYIL